MREVIQPQHGINEILLRGANSSGIWSCGIVKCLKDSKVDYENIYVEIHPADDIDELH